VLSPAGNKKDPSQAIYYYELDKLYELNGTPPQKRYEVLVGNHEHLIKRSNALIREIKVLLLANEYDKALGYLQDNYFPRQEDIDDIHEIYVDACLLKGMAAMRQKAYSEAIDDFIKADHYPENHLIGRDENYERNAQIFYYQALAMENNGMADKAQTSFRSAAIVQIRNPEYKYYKALALIKIGKKKEANNLLDELNQSGKERIEGKTDVDFFSKFGEGESGQFIKADGYYLRALASLGKNEVTSARKYLGEAKKLNPNHLWAGEILKNLKIN
jgi:tetratricopeptide (TPR) repeat protein